MNENSIWGSFWIRQAVSKEIIENKMNSSVKKLLFSLISTNNFEIDKIRVVELGSGMGVNSLLLALRGANVTLVDNNEVALEKAQELYALFNIKPNIVCDDVFNFSKQHSNCYDLSMSFGLVEHFKEDYRKNAIKIHVDVLKNQGMAIISVPNSRCMTYQFWFQSLKVLNRFSAGYEQPFTKSELMNYGNSIGLTNLNVLGVNSLKSMDDHLLVLLKLFFSKIFFNDQIMNKAIVPDIYIPLIDNHIGYALWLVGKK